MKSISKIQLVALLFNRQHGNLPTGGFYNPTIEYEDEKSIMFRCFYDGFDSEGDSWHWELIKETGEFIN